MRDDEASQGQGGRWGAFLRQITERPGWTVQRLASESGIHRSTIFRWRNGSVKNVTIDNVRLIAEAAGVELATALRAASDLVSTPARNAEELSEDIQKVLDDADLPPEERYVIAQMLLDEFDRDEQERRRTQLERARATVETWKRAREA